MTTDTNTEDVQQALLMLERAGWFAVGVPRQKHGTHYYDLRNGNGDAEIQTAAAGEVLQWAAELRDQRRTWVVNAEVVLTMVEHEPRGSEEQEARDRQEFRVTVLNHIPDYDERTRLLKTYDALRRNAPPAVAAPTDGYDYRQLDMVQRAYALAARAGIKSAVRTTLQQIITIGNHLLEVKRRLGYANFTPWIAAEFAWSPRTAENYMRVAERFKNATVALLEQLDQVGLKTLYLLAAKSTPDDAVAQVLEHMQDQPVSHTEARAIIAAHRPAPVATVEEEEVEEEDFTDEEEEEVIEARSAPPTPVSVAQPQPTALTGITPVGAGDWLHVTHTLAERTGLGLWGGNKGWQVGSLAHKLTPLVATPEEALELASDGLFELALGLPHRARNGQLIKLIVHHYGQEIEQLIDEAADNPDDRQEIKQEIERAGRDAVMMLRLCGSDDQVRTFEQWLTRAMSEVQP